MEEAPDAVRRRSPVSLHDGGMEGKLTCVDCPPSCPLSLTARLLSVRPMRSPLCVVHMRNVNALIHVESDVVGVVGALPRKRFRSKKASGGKLRRPCQR